MQRVDLYTIPLPDQMKNFCRLLTLPLMAVLASLLVGCGGAQPHQDPLVTDQQDTTIQNTRLKKTRNIFFNIPSPMETAALLKRAGAQYNGKILNDVKNVDRYTSASRQALNLGIYGADLSYSSVFNQTQESMFYTAASRKLADLLGVTSAFDDATLERMERNMNNRDSLLNIISETYWNVDGYLKDNGRDNISALMIAGGWVEGLYIATQVARVNDSPELRQRIAEQKLSLEDLVALLDTYDQAEEALSSVRADLHSLAGLFHDVQTGGGESVTEENGVVVVGGGGTAAQLTTQQLASIAERTAEIRNNYIN
jgi:hypothetical protein